MTGHQDCGALRFRQDDANVRFESVVSSPLGTQKEMPFIAAVIIDFAVSAATFPRPEIVFQACREMLRVFLRIGRQAEG